MVYITEVIFAVVLVGWCGSVLALLGGCTHVSLALGTHSLPSHLASCAV